MKIILQKEDRSPKKEHSWINSLLDVFLLLLKIVFYPIYWIIRGVVYIVYGILKCIGYILQFFFEIIGEILEAILSGW